MEIRCWILNYLSDSFPHIRQVSFRSNSHVINLPVFNRRRFALIMLFPMCTNDKNLYSCLSIDGWVRTYTSMYVCVYVCDRMHINSFFIHLRVVVNILQYYKCYTCNTTFNTRQKNDWLLKKWQEFENSFQMVYISWWAGIRLTISKV